MGLVPKSCRMGCSAARELHRDRDVVTAVRPERRASRLVVVAQNPRVQLHDQPVLARHPGQLPQQVLPQPGEVVSRRDAATGLGVRASSGSRVESHADSVHRAVVGSGCAVLAEERPSRLDRGNEPRKVRRIDAAGGCEPVRVLDPSGRRDVEIAVGPKRRDDPARPRAVVTQRLVNGEVAAGIVRRREDVDPEPVEQRPGPHRWLGQSADDLVEQGVGVRR